MGRIVLSVFTTLDGVIENPHEWAFGFVSEDSMQAGLDQIRAARALLLGRVTYEGFAASWPSMTDEVGYADAMNNLPKYVVSTTLTEATWNNSTIIDADAAARIEALKKETDGDILVFGSAALVRWLLRQNLLDEMRLAVYPVLAGRGARLFDGDSTDSVDFAGLRLAGTQAFSSGVVLLTYEPTGEGLADPGAARRAAEANAKG
ncbi:Dihydrofolate reductase [Microbispora rosea]|uniref:Dihydrofolate reductase n=1 Tax=Microbispora rosea TaxID=58117 RepID=A0A1N7HDC3_9ACTN|nr:dihydrofolate reductase family protein [Microbispora rosea]GIH52664.1 pyrimidine reductase [Microbispora rosea subsp. rosea]SIS22865.1 Dihydrofolate reductase [Microbispora rosea]